MLILEDWFLSLPTDKPTPSQPKEDLPKQSRAHGCSVFMKILLWESLMHGLPDSGSGECLPPPSHARQNVAQGKKGRAQSPAKNITVHFAAVGRCVGKICSPDLYPGEPIRPPPSLPPEFRRTDRITSIISKVRTRRECGLPACLLPASSSLRCLSSQSLVHYGICGPRR